MKDGNYKPAIYFFKTCYNCLRTIPMLGHDKQNPETYDTHGEDHATDAVIYACLSRPFAPMRTKAKRGDYDAYADKPKRRSSWTYQRVVKKLYESYELEKELPDNAVFDDDEKLARFRKKYFEKFKIELPFFCWATIYRQKILNKLPRLTL